MFQFADDSTIACAHECLTTAVNYLNNDLDNIVKYCNTNRIMINPNKTKAMHFSTHSKIAATTGCVFTNGSCIEFVNSFKFLGIIIDNKLSFRQHIL